MRHLKKLLLKQHRARLRQLKAELSGGSDADLATALAEVENCQKLIAAADRHVDRRATPVIVGLICVLVVAFLASRKVEVSPIAATLWTSSISLHLTETWATDDGIRLDPTMTVVSRFATRLSGEPRDEGAVEEASDVWLTNGPMELGEIGIDSGGVLEWDVSGPDVTLSVRGAASQAVIWVSGATLTRRGTSSPIGSPGGPGERLEAKTTAEGGFRASLTFGLPEPLLVRGFVVDSIDTTSEQYLSTGMSRWRPALLGGSIRLPDVDDSVAVPRSEPLTLEGFEGRVLELEVGDSIRVRLEGTVRRIRVGEGDFLEDHTPTLLEYFYYQTRLRFLWGALAFVWGLIWSARRILGWG